MPIEELLAQAGAEHQALKAKYDEAMLEIAFLRTKLTTEHVPDHHATVKKSRTSQTRHFRQHLQEDAEAATFEHTVVCEQLHSTNPGVVKDDQCQSTSSQHKSSNGQAHYLRFSNSQIDKDTDSRSPWQNSAHRFLVNPVVEVVLVVVLMINCVIMWIETDAKAASSKATRWTESVDTGFLVLYTIEFALRVFAYRSHVFRDKWARLDCFVILIDVSSAIGKELFGTSFSGGLNVSLFRLFRLFRVARVFKIFRHVTELQLLIFGFFGAVKGVIFAVVMLEIVIIVFSFILVETIHPLTLELKCEICITAYSSMWRAHLSIVQQIIAGDSWGQVNMLIIEAHPETLLVFVACLVVIQFAMLNLIFTVIVDAAHRARCDDEQQLLAEKEHAYTKLKEKLIGLCQHLDTDGSGELCLQELIDGYENTPGFADTMASLDIGVEDMEVVFSILDEDRSGAVSCVEFVNNIYKLKSQDIHTMLMFIKGYLLELRIKVHEDVAGMLSKEVQIVTNTEKDIKQLMSQLKLMVPSSAARNSEADVGMTTWAKPFEEGLLVEPQRKVAKTCEAVDSHFLPKKAETTYAAEDATCFHVSEDMIRPPPVRVPTPSGPATSSSGSHII